MNRFASSLLIAGLLQCGCLPAARAEEAPRTGLMNDYAISAKLFPSTVDYFKAPVPGEMYRAFKSGNVPSAWVEMNRLPPEECVEFDPKEHSTVLFVPKSYDGGEPFGVYVHVSPGVGGLKPDAEYQAVMEKLKLILVSPNKAGNSESLWRRVALAMDSLATVCANYRVASNRVFVGGLSGGGHIAFVCHMLYPERFQGAVSHAAQSYLPTSGSSGHFPGLDLSDARSSPRRDRRWVIISGPKDRNYQEILKTNPPWTAAKIPFRFIDVPDMGHQKAPAPALEEALVWIAGNETAGAAVSGGGAGVAPGTPAAAPGELRTWTARSGAKIEARIVNKDPVWVDLETTDGRRVRIALVNLSDEDRAVITGAGAAAIR